MQGDAAAAVALALMLGAALLVGSLWLMINSNHFHIVHATQATSSSQPASSRRGK